MDKQRTKSKYNSFSLSGKFMYVHKVRLKATLTHVLSSYIKKEKESMHPPLSVTDVQTKGQIDRQREQSN